MYVQCAQHYCNTQPVAVRTHRYRPSQYNLLCTFTVHNITVTQPVAVRTHRYRPSQYNLLCTFSVHNITVTHNVLLSVTSDNTYIYIYIYIYIIQIFRLIKSSNYIYCNSMHIMWAKVKYLQCYISLYSKTASKSIML